MRPQPGAQATARRLRAAGICRHAAPLFRIVPLSWSLSDDLVDLADAVLWTSANALRMAQRTNPSAFALLRQYPGLCVGTATARVAQKYGIPVEHAGNADVVSLLSHPACAAYRHIIWPCGKVHTAISDARVHALPCYETQPIENWRGQHQLETAPHAIVLHSTAAAQRLSQLVKESLRSAHDIIAISSAVARAAGSGWRAIHTAATPDDVSILALCRDLCQKYDHENG